MQSWNKRRRPAVCLALLAFLASVGCERERRAPQAGFRHMQLDGIGDKPLRITLPRPTVGDWGLIPPGALMYGSIQEGLLADVTVGILPPQARDCFELSRTRKGCEPRRDLGTRVVLRCVESDGIDLFVEHRREERPLCCLASWSRHATLTVDQQRMAAGVEAACDTLAPL